MKTCHAESHGNATSEVRYQHSVIYGTLQPTSLPCLAINGVKHGKVKNIHFPRPTLPVHLELNHWQSERHHVAGRRRVGLTQRGSRHITKPLE